MTREDFENASVILEDIERCKQSLGTVKLFKEDVQNLTCKFTRVSLFGVVGRDAQVPVEVAEKVAGKIIEMLVEKIAELDKEFADL